MLEVCVDSLAGVEAAQAAGADRIEFCSVLEVGGVTPTPAVVRDVRQAISIPLIALVRVRAGNFIYSSREKQVMLREMEDLIALGVDGLAIGSMTERGQLDIPFLREARALSNEVQWVHHRAFDEASEPLVALEQLCDLGYHRILTSGGAPTAYLGRDQIAQLVQRSRGRIEILPGGGVSLENGRGLLMETGCNQLHGSFRTEGFPCRVTIQKMHEITSERW